MQVKLVVYIEKHEGRFPAKELTLEGDDLNQAMITIHEVILNTITENHKVIIYLTYKP